MDRDELRARCDAARAAAALMRRDARTMLRDADHMAAADAALRRDSRETFAQERAGELRKDRQVGVQPNPIQAPDTEGQ
jgi:hypothetical protein